MAPLGRTWFGGTTVVVALAELSDRCGSKTSEDTLAVFCGEPELWGWTMIWTVAP